MKLHDALQQPNVIGITGGIAPGAVNVVLSAHGRGERSLTYFVSSPSSAGRSWLEAANEDPDLEDALTDALISSVGN